MEVQALSAVNRFRAVVERHDARTGVSVLRWHDLALRVRLAHGVAEGQELEWSIAPDQVRPLSNSGRPMRPDDTPFVGRLVELSSHGGQVEARAQMVDCPAELVLMTAQAEIARAHGMTEGALLTLRLRGQGIRVWPADQNGRQA